MPAKSWSQSPRVILGSLTTLNALNYLDRYVSAATLPLILTDLAISDAQGGLLQSLFIVAYALACGPAGWRAAFFVAGAPGAALAFLLLFLTEPARGAQDRSHGAATPLGLTPWLRALASRRSYLVNTAAQIIYTFGMGGLATWMPTYFVRERGIPLASAAATFGLLLVVAGFAGTLLGGRLSSAVVRRHPGADFIVSGWSLVVSIV